MIKLTKTYPSPRALETVGYKHYSVKEQLYSDQHGKCCYCEQSRGGGFFDVEHFRPKSHCQQAEGMAEMNGYSWLVNDWDNLLYSCNECNRKYKRILFPLRVPDTRDVAHQDISNEEPLLLNPYFDDVSAHLCFNEEYAVAAIMPDGTKSDKGAATIDILKLNDRPELVAKRKRVWMDYRQNVLLLQRIADSMIGEQSTALNSIVHSNKDRLLSDKSEFLGMLQRQQQ